MPKYVCGHLECGGTIMVGDKDPLPRCPECNEPDMVRATEPSAMRAFSPGLGTRGKMNVLATTVSRVPHASSSSTASSSPSALVSRHGTHAPSLASHASSSSSSWPRPRSPLRTGPSLGSPAPSRGVVYGADRACITCGTEGRPHLPPLAQSEPTRRLCTLIALSCYGARVLKNTPSGIATRGFMVGVLACGDKLYVAMSGARTLQKFVEVIAALRKELPELALLQVVGEIPPKERCTAGGASIDGDWVAEVRDHTPAGLFECAAPKLIHHVLHNVLHVETQGLPADLDWSMTEMWVGPSDGYHHNGVVYESCGNCQQILPMMLCGLAPVPLTAPDGFTLVASDKTKKNMRAGRK